jgi:hypothetical protein
MNCYGSDGDDARQLERQRRVTAQSVEMRFVPLETVTQPCTY